MDRKALKEQLHQKIGTIENDQLLERLNSFLEINIDLEEPYVMTDAERHAVQEGWNDFLKGNVTSDEDFDKEMDEWEKR